MKPLYTIYLLLLSASLVGNFVFSSATTNLLNTHYSILNTKRAFHDVFNVANGKDNTVLQLVDALNKSIGKDIKPVFLPLRAGDVFRSYADISKLKTMFGYRPRVDFENGLRRTVEYFDKKILVNSKC